MNPFEELLKELGNLMEISLREDSHQSCCLNFPDGISVQIDLHTNADQLLIGSQLGQVPPGAYRERVFRQALIFNGLMTLPQGILAFSNRKDLLILFQFLPIVTLNGEKLFRFLQDFVARARSWHEALARGEIPSLNVESPSSANGFYGLKQ